MEEIQNNENNNFVNKTNDDIVSLENDVNTRKMPVSKDGKKQKSTRKKVEKQALKEMQKQKKERGMSRVKAEYKSKFVRESKMKKKVANNKGDYISEERKIQLERKKLKRGKRKKIERLSTDESNKSAGATTIALITKRDESTIVSPVKRLVNIISYGFVCVFAAILGFLSGNMYIQAAFSADYDYVESEWRYTDAELENIIASNSNVASVNALYAILIAEETLKNQDYYKIESPKGSSYTQPDIASRQSIYSLCVKDGKNYEYITVTEGIMSVAERVLTSDYQKFDIYRTKSVSNGVPAFPSSPSYTMTYEDSRAEYGTDFTNPIPYVISNKTMHSSYGGNVDATGRGTPNGDGTYTFKLKLNLEQSVMNYVKQMKHMSELANYPIFSSIEITFTLNENFEFTYMTIIEEYTVYYFGVPAKCHAEMHQEFSYTKE